MFNGAGIILESMVCCGKLSSLSRLLRSLSTPTALLKVDQCVRIGEWEKKSNWDLVVRVPLMIHVPWLPKSFGQRTSSLVELVDVMPTVAAIAGLPAPADVDGVDISSLLHLSPNRSSSTSQGELEVQLEAAYHQYPACGCNQNGTACFNQTRGGCNNTPRTKFGFMGTSCPLLYHSTHFFDRGRFACHRPFLRPYFPFCSYLCFLETRSIRLQRSHSCLALHSVVSLGSFNSVTTVGRRVRRGAV